MKNLILLLCLPLLLLSATSVARGQLTFYFIETDDGVESFGEGALDLFDLSADPDPFGGGFGTSGRLVIPSLRFDVGPTADVDFYTGFLDGPTTLNPNLGAFTSARANEASGDTFGFTFSSTFRIFIVPEAYTSNTPLSGSAFYADETFETLGLVEGQLNWSLGGNALVTLNVGGVSVPEPATGVALPLLFVLAASIRRRTI